MTAALLLALTAGCSGLSTENSDTDDLLAARDRWYGSGVTSYHYTLDRTCQCLGDRRRVVVTVVNDSTASVVDAESGAPADTANLRGLLTVEQMFAYAEFALGEERDWLRIRYDPTMGYLTVLSMQWQMNTGRLTDQVFVTGFQSQ